MPIIEISTGFGEKLRELRMNARLTQEELAGKMFVTRQAISGWERGRHEPDIEGLRRLAMIFNITIDDLLSMGGIKMITVNYRRGGVFMLPPVTIAVVLALLLGAPWMAICSIALFGYVTSIILILLGKRTKTPKSR